MLPLDENLEKVCKDMGQKFLTAEMINKIEDKDLRKKLKSIREKIQEEEESEAEVEEVDDDEEEEEEEDE